jgi:hypothetical protein
MEKQAGERQTEERQRERVWCEGSLGEKDRGA